jgi:predicted phosphodiesterase
MTGRSFDMTYYISDIHGCYGTFMELMEKIQFTPPADTLYVLGDAIDRGEQPDGM